MTKTAEQIADEILKEAGFGPAQQTGQWMKGHLKQKLKGPAPTVPAAPRPGRGGPTPVIKKRVKDIRAGRQ